MQDIFKGFLVLRLVGLLALLVVVAAVLGISALSRGADVLGIVLLVAALALTVATGSLLARRARSRRR